ncbi:MAG: flagellar biosynthesis protein FlhF [Bdellovibrionales bacterium]|nr:flagellar biosynthesis protein FlhF [Bdellovibrionales bacterium]
MQIRKFEAPTIQEAIETIKRELGPEAIILQTKKNKRGFGLMSKGSVEVTAAIADKAAQKKQLLDQRLSPQERERFNALPAEKQVSEYDKNLEKWLEARAAKTREKVSLAAGRAPTQAPAPAVKPADRPPSQASMSTSTSAPAQGASYDRRGGWASRVRDEELAAPPDRPISAPPRSNISSREQEQIRAQFAKGRGAEPSGAETAPAARPADTAIHQEVQELRKLVEQLKNQPRESSDSSEPAATLSTTALREAYEALTLQGVDRKIAYALMRSVAFELPEGAAADPDAVLDQTAAQVMEQAEVMNLLEGIEPGKAAAPGEARRNPAVVALVGPTGVGKTTTLAKIASEAVLKRGLKVGLLNVDTYKVAAVDQLAAYAQILKVPFRSVADASELALALQDFQGLDLVLMDTTGRSQRDDESLRSMEHLIRSVPGVRTQLVLSVTTREPELQDMGRRFSQLFRPEGLIFSKLDEAMSFGAIMNASDKLKLPLVYFTTGQRVPQDIEGATKERVAALVMEL